MKNENKKERLNSISNGVDKVVIGNWKMNPNTKEEGTVLVKEIEKGIETINEPDIVVAPPFLFLSSVKDNLSKIKLGAQNVYGNSGGAHTGEVSIEELKNIGVEYVIVGHSERRKDGETDEEIARKVKVVINSDLTAVLCVGESKEIRDKGIDSVKDFIGEQLQKNLFAVIASEAKSRLKVRGSSILKESGQSRELNGDISKNLLIAYEPVWAISSNKGAIPAKPEEISEVVSFIKEFLKNEYSLITKVLYGGSVSVGNVKELLKVDEVDGFLVGGASLNSEQFIEIIKTTTNY